MEETINTSSQTGSFGGLVHETIFEPSVAVRTHFDEINTWVERELIKVATHQRHSG